MNIKTHELSVARATLDPRGPVVLLRCLHKETKTVEGKVTEALSGGGQGPLAEAMSAGARERLPSELGSKVAAAGGRSFDNGFMADGEGIARSGWWSSSRRIVVMSSCDRKSI